MVEAAEEDTEKILANVLFMSYDKRKKGEKPNGYQK